MVTGVQTCALPISLGQKLVQLTMPGVPDVYQGTEFATFSLVDPDNRRPVDFAARRDRLAALDAGEPPRDLDEEKLLITARALAVRGRRPEAFAGDYRELSATSEHAFGFVRGGEVITLVTRLPRRLSAAGGWAEHTVDLPSGTWQDVLTARQYTSGPHALARLLETYPVALLVRG